MAVRALEKGLELACHLRKDVPKWVAGDPSLKQVAKTHAYKVKRSGDLAPRYGGEEFVVVLGNTNSK